MIENHELSQPQTKEDPESLVLRGRPRPAVRFRRGLIIALTAGAAACLVTLSWLALEPPSLRKAAAPLDSEDQPAAKPPPDAFAALPKSYGDVPRLGPPLPGDLGRAVLAHQQALSGAGGMRTEDSGTENVAATDRNAELEAHAEESRQAALSAGLMVQLEHGPAPSPPTAEPGGSSPPPSVPAEASLPSNQRHKIEFAQANGDAGTGSQQNAAQPSATLSAGTVIPASLLTGLNSDLPGIVLAQVTEDVRDSATGRFVLVPQGARLIGNYDSAVAFGQRRALLVWSRIVFPDGSSIELDHMPATDASGYSGLSDRVDSHGWQLLKGIALSTFLGVGTQLGIGGSSSDLVRAIRESAQENAAHAGDQMMSRNLDVQPTIIVRPGWPVRALVNKDLVLKPWTG